jgi:hypothetical protein
MAKKILKILEQFGLIAIICVIGTLVEWSLHDILNALSVRPNYIGFSLIFGPFWAFFVYIVFRYYFKKYLTFAVLVSFNEAFLLDASLQAKHYFDGYDPILILPFMVLHFLLYLGPAVLIFKNFREVFGLE